jgi:hypothetical protein
VFDDALLDAKRILGGGAKRQKEETN